MPYEVTFHRTPLFIHKPLPAQFSGIACIHTGEQALYHRLQSSSCWQSRISVPRKRQPPCPGHPPFCSLYESESSRDLECHHTVSVPPRRAISLSGSSRLIHGVVWGRTPFLFKAEQHPIVWTDHVLCLHSPTDRHLGRFLLLAAESTPSLDCVLSCLVPGP